MIYLGIDYGRRKIGVALSEGTLAQPLGVIGVSDFADAVLKVSRLISEHQAPCVVIGVSEGQMAEETKRFGSEIEGLGADVVYWDETLTSQEAQSKLIATGKGKRARRGTEDSAAAALMLQSYLDTLSDEELS